jgi:hypothetical protein
VRPFGIAGGDDGDATGETAERVAELARVEGWLGERGSPAAGFGVGRGSRRMIRVTDDDFSMCRGGPPMVRRGE